MNAIQNGVGKFLIFQQELLQLREVLDVENVDLYVCNSRGGTSREIITIISRLNPYLGNLNFVNRQEEVNVSATDYRWPGNTDYASCSYSESYQTVQKYWEKTHKIVQMKTPETVKQLAQIWMDRHVADAKMITIHLKNNALDLQSNANQQSWLDFFLYSEKETPDVKFVIIGLDKVDDVICSLHNVISVQNHGGNLELDLALVDMSTAFMGMASGPCNRAILSDKPYLIWKHPGHHQEAMERELVNPKGFGFANRNQKFMVEWDTFKNLQHEFAQLINNT